MPGKKKWRYAGKKQPVKKRIVVKKRSKRA
jgi:hypothetical protein